MRRLAFRRALLAGAAALLGGSAELQAAGYALKEQSVTA
jgi:hypothetical protein